MKHTDLVVLMDRSGSMAALAHDMEGGFDAMMKEQAHLDGTCNVTLVQFDSQDIDTVYTGKPVSEVPPLKLQARGGTPLLDALGSTITGVAAQIEALPADRRPEQVMVIAITDGQENASSEYTLPQVRKLIERQTAAGWTFVYLGANVDAFGEAQAMGIATMQAAAYDYNAGSARAMFAAASQNLCSYRASSTSGFTDSQRKAMSGNAANSSWAIGKQEPQ